MSKGIWDKSGPFELLVHYPGKPMFDNPIYSSSAWPGFNQERLIEIRNANYADLIGITFEGSWGNRSLGFVTLSFGQLGPVIRVGSVIDGRKLCVSENISMDDLTQRVLDYVTEEYNKKIRGIRKHDLQRYRDIQNSFKKL